MVSAYVNPGLARFSDGLSQLLAAQGMDFSEAYPDRCSTVGAAVRLGDAELLRELLAGGSSADVHDNRGWTPLHEAANGSHYDCAKLLLRRMSKEDVNIQTWEGETAIFFVAKNGHEKLLRLLVRKGGDPGLCNNEGGSPVLQAVAGNHEACIVFLLERGTNADGQLNCSGWSPLHEAACRGFAGALRLLLRAGATVDCRDDFGIAPVFTAAQYGHLACLELLLQHGADPDSQADDGATPLYLAAQEGHVDCVAHLLAHGASPDISIKTEDYFLPIHAAAYKGRTECVELLLPGSLPALEAPVLSPLHLAARGGHDGTVRRLLEVGCDPDCGVPDPSAAMRSRFFPVDGGGGEDTPLCLAVWRGHRTAARILREAGASVCRPSGSFCLVTADDRRPGPLDILVELGADVACPHVWSQEGFLLRCRFLYFKRLVGHGLRSSFSCRRPGSMCPATSGDRPLKGPRTIERMALMHRYVSRLDLCHHSLSCLQRHDSEAFKSLACTPRSLLHLCRVAITEHIGTTKAHRVIPAIDFLPTVMKDYLLYKDVET